jgi:hypothetical protein
MDREICLTRGLVAIVDDADYERFNEYTWSAMAGGSGFIAARRVMGRLVSLHREITGAKKGETVDHRNGNTLDNRRQNLRVCTARENWQNRKRDGRNTTGYKGVSKRHYGKKFRAYIYDKGKQKFLGDYDLAEEAAKAYDQAAVALYGSFARTNFKIGTNTYISNKASARSITLFNS